MRAVWWLLGMAFAWAGTAYMTNHDCKECHPEIYDEYESSWHAKGYFRDRFHHAAANHTPGYDCARCHMPAAKEREMLARDEIEPKEERPEHSDAVSCFYCHQIAYVKAAHKANDIVLAKQAEGANPQLFGSLDNPDSSDKHAMVKSPIYDKYACSGCHSHKRNKNDVLIFRAMKEGDDSRSCIRCHMPTVSGGAEKMNKKSRTHHHAHTFIGIHDETMRAKGADITISPKNAGIDISLHNKMAHPFIIQPARVKYLDVRVLRDGKEIWRNFAKDPKEDVQAYFATEFLDANGTVVAVPYDAKKRGYVNNLDANETRVLHYDTPPLQKGDRIVVTLYAILANKRCVDALGLDSSWNAPLFMKREEATVK